MPKLRFLSGKEVCKILQKFGFKLIRQRGSHMIMQKVLSTTTISVPVPDYKELKIGTLRSIIRQSGTPRDAFE